MDFDENAITAVRCNRARRDRGHLRNAYRADSAAIVENQSLAVDTVRARLQHLQRRAGGCGGSSSEPAGNPRPGARWKRSRHWTGHDTDVVVVGAIAGLTAALTAAQAGADVIFGGKARRLAGRQPGLLTAAGFYGAETSVVPAEVEDHRRDVQPHSGHDRRGQLGWNAWLQRIRHLCESAPELVEWLESMGYEFTTTDFGIRTPSSTTTSGRRLQRSRTVKITRERGKGRRQRDDREPVHRPQAGRQRHDRHHRFPGQRHL